MTVTDRDNNKIPSLKNAADNLKDEIAGRVDEARARVNQSVEDSMQTLYEHPILVLGATLAAGIVLGILLGRKSNVVVVHTQDHRRPA